MNTARMTKDGLPAGFLAQSDAFSTIRFELRADKIGILTLNRPDKLNAFDETMIREIRQVIWRANFDDNLRVLIITGAGRAFCSGRDILGLDYENNLPSAQYRAYVRANHEMLDDLESIEKPVIAAVNGVCAGGGVEIAIACDFRIAAKGAEFILTENKLGVLPASGACSRMIQMIGIGRLKEMVMAALPVGAERAEAIGLVHRVCEQDGMMEGALEFARHLLGRAPLAMGVAKQIINTCQNVDTETGRILERLGQSILIRSEDAREGMLAFREKRSPDFKNK
ncbi:MAG: enoyl-CoA hydratase/isomerase family protein [Betaproteobacteria bacterium]|nr:enoyl-CoA hydratase/isomerase family protein [Betaproteobacteria bacterium]